MRLDVRLDPGGWKSQSARNRALLDYFATPLSMSGPSALSSSQTIFCLKDGKISNSILLKEAETMLYENILYRHIVLMRQNKATALLVGAEIQKEELVEGWERPIREYNYSSADASSHNHSTLSEDILHAVCRHVILVIKKYQDNGVETSPFPSMKSILDGTSRSCYPKLNIDAFEVANPIKKAAECGVLEALIRHVRHPDFIDTEEKLLESFGNFDMSLSESWKKKQTTSEEKKQRSFREDLPKLRAFYNAMIHCDIMTGKPVVSSNNSPRRAGLSLTMSNSSGQRIVERIKEYVLTVMRHSRKGLSNGGNRNVASDCRSEIIRQHFQFVKRKGNGQKKSEIEAAAALLGNDPDMMSLYGPTGPRTRGPGLKQTRKSPRRSLSRDRRLGEPSRRKDESSSQLQAMQDRETEEYASALTGLRSSDNFYGQENYYGDMSRPESYANRPLLEPFFRSSDGQVKVTTSSSSSDSGAMKRPKIEAPFTSNLARSMASYIAPSQDSIATMSNIPAFSSFMGFANLGTSISSSRSISYSTLNPVPTILSTSEGPRSVEEEIAIAMTGQAEQPSQPRQESSVKKEIAIAMTGQPAQPCFTASLVVVEEAFKNSNSSEGEKV